MADNVDGRAGQAVAYQALTAVFAQGFRFLVTVNGAGVLLTLLAATGFIETDMAPPLFRMPLAAFLGGLALSGVGLLWSFVAQTSLFGQLMEGRRRRGHWVPMICVLVAYALSLVVFVVGCWLTLGLANLAYHDPEHFQSYDQSYGRADDVDEVSAEAVRYGQGHQGFRRPGI